MLVRQCRLQSGDRMTTAWLPARNDLRVGVDVTLKNHPEPERRWRVLAVGETREQAAVNRGWHVGGL